MHQLTKNLFLKEVKKTESLLSRINLFADSYSDFILDMLSLPERELKDYFMDSNDLDKLATAKEIIDTIKESAYNYGQNKALKLIKAK